MDNRYRAEYLGNGYIRVYDYVCKWDGLYYADTYKHYSGACSNLSPEKVKQLVTPKGWASV
jgi:hypothetical protein